MKNEYEFNEWRQEKHGAFEARTRYRITNYFAAVERGVPAKFEENELIQEESKSNPSMPKITETEGKTQTSSYSGIRNNHNIICIF